MRVFSEIVGEGTATLTGYVLDGSTEMGNTRIRPAVLVLPGGGYFRPPTGRRNRLPGLSRGGVQRVRPAVPRRRGGAVRALVSHAAPRLPGSASTPTRSMWIRPSWQWWGSPLAGTWPQASALWGSTGQTRSCSATR